MYKLLIVDDEEIVVNGLKRFVNWEALGYEVVTSCTSVDEAEIILKENKIDVVLTDINMPIKSGFDLLQILCTSFPSVKSIILSGYEDFAYAKKALKFGCFDYLTKPVNFSELTEMFEKLKKVLDSKKNSETTNMDYINIKQNILLNNILCGSIKPTALENFNNIKLINEPYFIIRLNINFNINQYNDFVSIQNIIYCNLNEILKRFSNFYYIVENIKDLSVIVYPKSKHLNLSNELFELCQNVLDSTFTKVNIGISNIDNNINNISCLYENSGIALLQSINKNEISVLNFNDLKGLKDEFLPLSSDEKQEFTKYLSSLNTDGFIAYSKYLLSKTSANLILGNNELYSLAIELTVITCNYISNFSFEKKFEFQIEDFTKNLLKNRTKNSIIDFSLNTLYSLSNKLNDIIASCSNNIIDSAILFINQNYWKDISLNSLSDVLYIHPIYLSRLFKEKTGQNYIKYLTDVRIEKAKALLKDRNLKIYSITELVGYESPKYFSKVFKETVGLTPKEYRDSLN